MANWHRSASRAPNSDAAHASRRAREASLEISLAGATPDGPWLHPRTDRSRGVAVEGAHRELAAPALGRDLSDQRGRERGEYALYREPRGRSVCADRRFF